MANDPLVTGFDATEVRAGLRLAMRVGLPPLTEDQPAFYLPQSFDPVPNEALDQEGVPFDPTYRPTKTARVIKHVPCAIEYHDGQGKLEAFGVIQPTKVVLTLLDQDYAQVEGFDFVVIGGTKYFRRHTETPKGLVTVGLFKVHCESEDEG